MEDRRLILVAGPPCSGKSTFISQLTAGRLTAPCEALKITDPGEWAVGAKNRWEEVRAQPPERLVFHYDFLFDVLRGSASASEVYESDPALRLPDIYKQTDIVTLWTEPVALLRRVRQRRFQALKTYWLRGKVGYGLHRDRRLRSMKRLYRQERKLMDVYEEWFAFAETVGANRHWIADTTEPTTRLTAFRNWRPEARK